VAASAALAAAVLAGCGGGGGGGGNGGPVAAPTFTSLELPPPSGNTWTTISSISPPPEVLPTRGRGVRLKFDAPGGSVFNVSLRDLAGATVATLTQNSGGNPPPEAGFFEILSEDVSTSPAKFHMYVRAPEALSDPLNYDILVVHQSLRTDMTDSSPMVVSLRKRKVFTVNVTVQGDGHVTSNPSGIQCGTTPSGQALTDCSHDFGPGPGPVQVSLLEGSNNLNVTKFKGWAGNCAPNVQICVLSLDGTATMAATAIFGPSGSATASSCAAAPTIAGLRWIDVPDCATGNIAGHPGISHPALCDANGYYCCEPGSGSAPRCGGAGKIESPPDCLRDAPRGRLVQPGGCYEVDSFP
jgi:hypothetical protein